jgi:quinol monooxygenase YgiN
VLIVSGIMRFELADREEILEGLKWVTERSRTDSGCIDYWFAEDIAEPGCFRVFERWETSDDFATHRVAPHEEQWNEKYLHKMTSAEVAQYEVSGREPIVGD